MPKKILKQASKDIEALRNDMLFDELFEPVSTAPELVQLKFLQAVALLEQAQALMKEAALLTPGGVE